MTEQFLHYIWKFQLFEQNSLQCESGESLQIIKAGTPNTDAGPDFFNTKIKIGSTLWAGNVEIHINSSDWEKHSHQKDAAYDNVILHVVFNHDKNVVRKNGQELHVLTLQEKINDSLYAKYCHFLSNKLWIPCANHISEVDVFTVDNWLERLLIERLERKSSAIVEMLERHKNDWAEVFYIFLARNFGFKVNAEPMELLAKSLPFSVIGKHRDNLLQVEALLLGQAGFLEENFADDYPNQLKKEYDFLKNKFKLQPLDKSLLKFLRLRPPNFPTIRISQLANLIHRSSSLFSKIIEAKNSAAIIELFQVETSEYWRTHYVFDKHSSERKKQLGESAVNGILINTVAPFLFVYGQQKGEDVFKTNAFKLLENLPEEKNAIINRWKELNISARDAYRSQALLQLKNEYCNAKKCLHCAIGNKILRFSQNDK
ncbi:MAG: hypothetical protein COA57_15160 [Flavobacteriales bacterium]|nr:MAG: hypothetical protein COA57_15160 [Flavobacteriales bacterium]